MSKGKRSVLEMAPGALSEYYDWIKSAAHGDTLVYWVGDLQFERQIVISPSDLLRKNRRDEISSLNVLASRLHDDAKAGLVKLTQKRLDWGVFEYRAHRFRTEHPGQKQGSGIRNDNLVPA